MGFDTPETFDHQLEKHRKIVHSHFDKLLEAKDSEPTDDRTKEIKTGLEAIWENLLEDKKRQKILLTAGYENFDEVERLLDHLRNHPATRSLSSDGRQRLDRLMPLMLKEIGRSSNFKFLLQQIKTITLK